MNFFHVSPAICFADAREKLSAPNLTMMAYLLRTLILLFPLFHIPGIVAQSPRCNNYFGTNIDYMDCWISLSELKIMCGLTGAPALNGWREEVWFASLTGWDRPGVRPFYLKDVLHKSCELTVYLRDEQTKKTSLERIFAEMERLIEFCVESDGLGGLYESNGFRFLVKNRHSLGSALLAQGAAATPLPSSTRLQQPAIHTAEQYRPAAIFPQGAAGGPLPSSTRVQQPTIHTAEQYRPSPPAAIFPAPPDL